MADHAFRVHEGRVTFGQNPPRMVDAAG